MRFYLINSRIRRINRAKRNRAARIQFAVQAVFDTIMTVNDVFAAVGDLSNQTGARVVGQEWQCALVSSSDDYEVLVQAWRTMLRIMRSEKTYSAELAKYGIVAVFGVNWTDRSKDGSCVEGAVAALCARAVRLSCSARANELSCRVKSLKTRFEIGLKVELVNKDQDAYRKLLRHTWRKYKLPDASTVQLRPLSVVSHHRLVPSSQ